METRFLTNPETEKVIKESLKKCERVDIAVAYLKNTGYELLKDVLNDLYRKNIPTRILVGLDFQATDPKPLIEIRKLKPVFKLKIYEDNIRNFHPKVYIFYLKDKISILIGSSNLSEGGLLNNIEANLIIQDTKHNETIRSIVDFYNLIWFDAVEPDKSTLNRYSSLKRKRQKIEKRIQRSRLFTKIIRKMESIRKDRKDRAKNEYWLVPKTTFKKFKDQLSALKQYDGLDWNLARKGLKQSKYDSLSRIGTIKSAYEDFGFVRIVIKNGKKILKITEIGNKLLQSDKPEEIFLSQILKWQFPNPSQKEVKGLKVFPLLVTLRILKDLEKISPEEMALFLFKMENMDDIEIVEGKIRDYRKLDNEIKIKKYGEPSKKDLRYISYIFTLFEETGLCKRKKNNLIITEGKEDKVKEILEKNKTKKVKEDFDLEKWYDYMSSISVE